MAERIFPDWEPAAKASKSRKALSYPFDAVLPGGKALKIVIVKPLHGDPWYEYASGPGLKVHGMKASASDCDRIKKWRAW